MYIVYFYPVRTLYAKMRIMHDPTAATKNTLWFDLERFQTGGGLKTRCFWQALFFHPLQKSFPPTTHHPLSPPMVLSWSRIRFTRSLHKAGVLKNTSRLAVYLLRCFGCFAVSALRGAPRPTNPQTERAPRPCPSCNRFKSLNFETLLTMPTDPRCAVV